MKTAIYHELDLIKAAVDEHESNEGRVTAATGRVAEIRFVRAARNKGLLVN